MASGSPWPLPEERARERELKREAVLSAAVRMFNRAGLLATSLGEVARALGVTKPTIYHYLANKDDPMPAREASRACVDTLVHGLAPREAAGP